MGRDHSAPTRRPADWLGIRTGNLSAVATFVAHRGSCSRREIEEALGFNKATVSSLVAELRSRGILADAGRTYAGRVGRPSSAVELDADTFVSLVAEIHDSYMVVSAWSLTAMSLQQHRRRVKVPQLSPIQVIRRVAAACRQLLAQLGYGPERVAGIVVAIPGRVDPATGTVVSAAPLGWSDVPAVELLRRHLTEVDAPAFIDRFANLAALAEWRHAHSSARHLVYLHGADRGLGVGVIVDGRLLTGHSGGAGEIMLPVAPSRGLPTGSSSSEMGVHAVAAETGIAQGQLDSERVLDQLVRQLDRKNRRAHDALQALATGLGHRTAILIGLFDPKVVILGGYFTRLRPWLEPHIQQTVSHLLADRHYDHTKVTFASVGKEALGLGGAYVVAQDVFSQPARMPQIHGTDSSVSTEPVIGLHS